MTSLVDARVTMIDVATDAAKVLRDTCLSGVQEEAFYVLDVGDVVRKHREWTSKMPRVHPFYAVKCHPNDILLRVLAALGTGFDCASKQEIEEVLSLGVDPSRIVFANPHKFRPDVSVAAAVGVDLMTFDTQSELYKVKELHPKAKLLVRIRCDAAVSIYNMGDKFGCDAVEDAPCLLQLARDLELDVVGVCFHVGTGCKEPDVFRRAISASRVLFDLGKSLGYDMNLLDLGGGFPGSKGSSLDEIGDVINLSLSEWFPSEDVRVIAEPGRYFVASAFTLAARVHSKRATLALDTHVAHNMYYINDGVYGSFSFITRGEEQITPFGLKSNSDVGDANKDVRLTPSSVWGASCDARDRVNYRILLPELQIGDWLVYENMGAYSLSTGCSFNGIPLPQVHAVADAVTWRWMQQTLQW